MTITEYSQLSSTGKIAYTQFVSGKITATTVNSLVTKNKISQDEADFIIGSV